VGTAAEVLCSVLWFGICRFCYGWLGEVETWKDCLFFFTLEQYWYIICDTWNTAHFFCHSHTQTWLNLCVTVKRLIYIRPFLRPKANGYGPSVIQVHKLRLFVYRFLNISCTVKQNINVYASFIASWLSVLNGHFQSSARGRD